MRLLILALIASTGAFADSYFTHIYEKTLSAAAGAVTLQQPAVPLKSGRLIGVQVKSSVAATFTIESSLPATTTASTAISNTQLGDTTKATFLVFDDSNATDATPEINSVDVAAAETKTILFNPDPLTGDSPGKISASPNVAYTVRSNSITGDIKVTLFWSEK